MAGRRRRLLIVERPARSPARRRRPLSLALTAASRQRDSVRGPPVAWRLGRVDVVVSARDRARQLGSDGSARRSAGPCPAASNRVDCMPVRRALRTRSAPSCRRPTGRSGSGAATPPTSTSWIRWRSAPTTSGAWPGRSCTSTATAAGCPATRCARADADLDTGLHEGPLRRAFATPSASSCAPDGGAGRRRRRLEHPGGGQPHRRGAAGSYGWPCYEGNHAHARLQGPRRSAPPEYAKEGAAAHVAPQLRLPAREQRRRRARRARVHRDSSIRRVTAATSSSATTRRASSGGSSWAQLVRTRCGVAHFASDWRAWTSSPRRAATSPTRSSARALRQRLDQADRLHAGQRFAQVARGVGPPTSGSRRSPVAFDCVRLDGPDGDPLTYDWDFGDGTPHGSGASPVAHLQPRAASTARTAHGERRPRPEPTRSTVTIAVGMPAPPVGGHRASRRRVRSTAVAQTIQLRGTATDQEDGPLPPSA